VHGFEHQERTRELSSKAPTCRRPTGHRLDWDKGPGVVKRRASWTLEIGDRVELLLFYSFHGDPPPRGEVVSIGKRCVQVKMDRNGKVVPFMPSDLHVIRKGKSR